MKHLQTLNELFSKLGDKHAKKVLEIVEKENIEINKKKTLFFVLK
jgi:hypothetical protein